MWKRNVLSISDFSPQDIERFLSLTQHLKREPQAYRDAFQGRYCALLFFEPSTRTYTSFRNAFERLGGSVSMEFRHPKGTSLEKRESIESVFSMAKEYSSDVMVIRHPRDGAAKYAAEVSDIPVINGGDGHHEHPTQNLMDLFTIYERFGKLDHLTFLFFNDLRFGRSSRLIIPLSQYEGNRFLFLSHPYVKAPEYVKRLLDQKGRQWEECFEQQTFPELLRRADVCYSSRTQEERFPKTTEGKEMLQQVRGSFVLTKHVLEEAKPKEQFIIMEPLPIDRLYPTIHPEVAATPWAYWNQQAGNGIPARQAILKLCLETAEKEG